MIIREGAPTRHKSVLIWPQKDHILPNRSLLCQNWAPICQAERKKMRDLSWRDEPESLTWPERVPTRSDARFPRDEALGEDPVGLALRSGLLITTLS